MKFSLNRNMKYFQIWKDAMSYLKENNNKTQEIK